MGKKKGTSASSSSKVSRDWGASTITSREASTVVRCYPPTPESGVEPEDDDDSEETEDAQHALEDSDVQEEGSPEDDALTRSRRRRRISDEPIMPAESSPSGRDDDADEVASPPPALNSSANLFAVEDDLDLSDDEIPLAKRAKFSSGRPESGKESNPSPVKRTPPIRMTVEKIPVSKVIPSGDVFTPSAARDHPIYATVDAVADFADHFTRLESENAQLRKTIKTSADQVLEANKLATDAQNENTLLKDELKKLKQKMKDDQDAKRKPAAAADEKEGVLRESIANFMTTGTSLSLEENYSLLIMGAAALMEMAVKMAVVSMEKPSGALPRPGGVPEQRLLSPRSWLRDGGGSGRFLVPWLFRIEDLGQGLYIGGRAASEGAGGADQGRAGSLAAPPIVRWPVASLFLSGVRKLRGILRSGH
ncbi:hypothetical protein QYE76_056399 [Lolium multiflorum]|uniref:Uncharacterized protein n=1 Tax=Lolium multiflorum TaxID=4521 RepID=A0AAD8T2G0_LOLMU|nr:hypothetical protein QYE76_056399 [Lolium multiflorum]